MAAFVNQTVKTAQNLFGLKLIRNVTTGAIKRKLLDMELKVGKAKNIFLHNQIAF